MSDSAIALPAPTAAVHPAAPAAAPAVSATPHDRRRLLRRVLRGLGLGVIGYVIVWLAATLGMLGLSTYFGQHYPSGSTVAGISHFLRVDGHVYRGAAPGADGYEALADRGITTVVDLRAEDLSAKELALPERAGLDVVRLPIRDGQTPTEQQVDRFLRAVDSAPGPVFVHCGAGVGRTGSVASAYLVETGQAGSREAAARTLAVGPPSVEQVYYVLNAGPDGAEQPPDAVQAASRALDAPRRIMSVVF